MGRRSMLALAVAAALFATPAAAHAVTFSQPIFVDRQLAGGEPLVATDGKHKTLAYTSHEGTTHLYRPGFYSPLPFGVNYRNQVNIWTSDNDGLTWKRTGVGGFSANPGKSAGFSDPDLTVDESGRMYNTGIDLVHDSLFSSQDGGKTWDRGTPGCHDGDRPWLAGGKPNEVFLATNTQENTLSHQIFHSTDGGNTCSLTSVPDQGTTKDKTLDYTGAGKIYYSHPSQRLIEPLTYVKHGSDGPFVGLGVGTWNRGDPRFTPHLAVRTRMFAHWPAIALDSADNVYLVWDEDATRNGTKNACGSGEHAAPNSIKLMVSHDFGKSWSHPRVIAHPPHGRAFWPWIVAGDKGRISVVWYETNKVVDVDCQPASITIHETQSYNADSAKPKFTRRVNAAGRPIDVNSSVCQGGTTCVVVQKDRRLGDFFTNGLDRRGCVLIASGDTTQTDPTTGQPFTVSLPIFLRQTSGRSLVGNRSCKASRIPPKASRGQCRDRKAPVTHLRRSGIHATRRLARLHGRSHDEGCHATRSLNARHGRVLRVYVSIAKVHGRHGCRFVNKRGRLDPKRNCRRPTLFVAKGTRHWSFRKRLHVPPGTYRAVARGIDPSGNRERPAHRNHVKFRIP
jgi:hypothetical protein